VKNKFIIISPMFNATKTLSRMLHSIVGQSYENWKLILIDDVSSSDDRVKIQEILSGFQSIEFLRHEEFNQPRIHVIWNSEKKWEVANVLQGLKSCNDDDIVVRIDADDFLTDLDAFRIIDNVYERTGCESLHTAHRWHDDHQVSFQNISSEFPSGSDPYKTPWVTSHLKTFRKRLLNNVKDENYRDVNGEYFKRIGDQTFHLPVLRNSKKNVYVPMVMYSYFCPMNPENFQTDDAKYQRDEAIYLRSRGYIE